MASRPTSETSSRSSTSRTASAEEVRAHSALHVLMGAVTQTLGPQRFTFGNAWVLKFRGEGVLTPQEVAKIETAANRKVAEDSEILEFTMDRQEAESHFGTSIYDVSAVPPNASLLRIVRIPDWDVSCCSMAHVESTGSIGAIRIDQAQFAETSEEIELRFRLL